MAQGRVETIHIVRVKRGEPEPLGEAALAPGRGLPGDHHDRAGVKRAITLIRAETLDDVGKALKIEPKPGASRRNVMVRGLDLDALAPGTMLRLGTALVEVRGPTDPCERMETALGEGALALMENRGGVHVRVLEGGLLRPGDPVEIASDSAGLPSTERTAFQSGLLAWFRAQKRDLPWRRTKDPYAIWISEVMLQQTQVATVIPYYERFLARFPTLRALADAPQDDVLALWSGLGYYARARNLHKAAKTVVELHGGELPRNLTQLRELSGFGPYTAGAVASIALGLDAALVDGNVARVLCRTEGWEVGAEEALRRAWATAPGLVPHGEAGDFNQALMELGATVCTPANPTCHACPVRAACAATKRPEPAKYPLPKVRAPKKSLVLAAACVRHEGRLLLVQREREGLFGGLWEPPTVPAEDAKDARNAVEGLVWELFDFGYDCESAGVVSQELTHRSVTVHVFAVDAGGAPPELPPGGRLVLPTDLAGLGISTLTAKVLQAAGVRLPHGLARRRAPASQGDLF